MTTTEQYVPDLAPLSMEEVDAYALPILEAAREAEDRAMKREAQGLDATTSWSLAVGYHRQAEPYVAEWARRGYPERVTRTRAQFVKTDPCDLVTFPEGRAPVVAPRPKGMSKKAFYEHIDRAGRVVLTWHPEGEPGRVFEEIAADAVSARAIWTTSDRFNHRNPTSRHRRVYLSARWAD